MTAESTEKQAGTDAKPNGAAGDETPKKDEAVLNSKEGTQAGMAVEDPKEAGAAIEGSKEAGAPAEDPEEAGAAVEGTKETGAPAEDLEETNHQTFKLSELQPLKTFTNILQHKVFFIPHHASNTTTGGDQVM